jgi:hypothetical protein
MNLEELTKRFDEARSRLDGLIAEWNELDAKVAADPNNEGLKTRKQNVGKGVIKAEAERNEAHAAWQAEILRKMEAGELDVEAGDDSGHVARGAWAGNVKLSPMAADLKAQRFDLSDRRTVTADAFKTLKASTFPTVTDLPRRQGGIVPIGRDSRFVYPLLPAESAGTALVVQDFKQTARTLTGTVKRSPTATTDKATVDVTLTSVIESMQQFAVIIPDIPNAMFGAVSQLSSFLATEGQFQVSKAIDQHVFAQIAAATPPSGLTGADLIAQVRNAVSAHRALGANPTLLVLNPTDAASLDLATDDGGYVFRTGSVGSSSPLWNLRVVESTDTDIAPHLIDVDMLGVLYLGQIEYAANPYSSFRKNLTDLRVEVTGLYHVRNATGAYVIEAEG